MKRFFKHYFCLLLLACALSSTINTSCYVEQESCYANNCYECGCNPLYCGAFDLQFQAGVAPIVWSHRGLLSFIICNDPSTPQPGVNPVVDLFNVPRFSKFFHVPWIVGGQIGYALSDNVRTYLEFDYVQASRKSDVSITSVIAIPETTIIFNPSKYQLFDAFIGARYYFDRWCDSLSLFLGFKAGLVHHKSISVNSTITPPDPAVVLTSDENFFNNNTRPAGGLNIGLDYCYCGNLSFVLTAELVASCGPRSNSIIPLVYSVVSANTLLVGSTGTELRFPITAGIRYSF